MLLRRLATLSAALVLSATAACDSLDRIRRESSGANAPQNTPPQTPPPPPQNPTPQQPTLQFPGLPSIPGLPLPFPGGNNPGTPPPPGNTTNLPPPPPGSYEPTGAMSQAFLRQEARAVFNELVGALGPTERGRIQGIPLMVTEDAREVNAAAGCTRSGRAFMLITSALLVVSANGAEAKAYDEVARGDRYTQYLRDVAAEVRGRRAVSVLAPGFLPGGQALDPRKLARQRFLFDEQVAFVLGHELAHHYRAHTGCANGVASHGDVTPEDVARLLANTVPLFNQPLEADADVWGVTNVLDAGRARQGGNWNEEGAMMTLGFFSQLSGLGVETLLLGFLRTHPPPVVRIPIVQLTAQQWRSGTRPGNTGSPLPLPIPLPLPLPTAQR